MHYISPVRFFESLQISDDDISDPKKLKKIVNLEFLSSETGIVSIDGFDYNKQEMLELVSDDDFAQKWQYHKKIWANRPLLDVLERESVDIKQLREVLAEKENEGFVRFVSPYFATPFNNIMKLLLSNNYVRDIYLWMQCRAYITVENEEVAYDGLRRYFDNALYFFRNINDTNFHDKLDEIRIWEPIDWSTVLNNLPDYLYQYRDEIPRSLTHVLVVIQYAERELCYQISLWLVKLQIASDNLAKTISSNHLAFKQNRKKSRSFSIKGGGWYFLIFVVVKIIIGMSTCNNSSNDFKDNTYYQQSIPLEVQRKIDSLKNARQDSSLSYDEVTYHQLPSFYYFTHQKDTINTEKGLDKKQLDRVPIYFSVYEGRDTALTPFYLYNNTGEILYLLYFQGENVFSVRFSDKTYLYWRPNGKKAIDFALNTFDNLKPFNFWIDGSQSVSLSLHQPIQFKEIDDQNPYLIPDSVKTVKDAVLTISIRKVLDKYYVATEGEKVYYYKEKFVVK